jgi:Tol biopolymer transport system component
MKVKMCAIAAVLIAIGLLIPTSAIAAAPDAQGRTLVSIGPSGNPGNAPSHRLALNGDGRFVVFTSNASNLVPGVSDGFSHVYVRDMWLRHTQLVDPGNGNGWDGRISDDGRFVVFTSDASNLVPGTTPGLSHIYVRDLWFGRTMLMDTNDAGSPADQDSIEPQISPDGGAVTFMSAADNLGLPGAGHVFAIYARNLLQRGATPVSVGMNGAVPDGLSYGPAIDGSHRFVAFASLASNLVPGDTNGVSDIFVRDLARGTTVRVSTGPGGVQGDGIAVGATISADGRYVGFASHAGNLAPGLPADHSSHSYVHDLATGATTLVDVNAEGKVGDAGSTWTGVSEDGRFVVFMSTADNLADTGKAGLWNAYLRDLRTGRTILLSNGAGGAQANGDSWWPVLSGDARTAGFLSFATNMLPGGGNGQPGVYLQRITAPPANDAAAASAPVRASNNQVLDGQGRADANNLAAAGSCFLAEPYLSYYATFSGTDSRVAWLGGQPMTADSVVLIDEWRVDYFGGPFTASKLPPGAVVKVSQNSIDIQWQTTAANSWYAEHTWQELDVMPTAQFGEIYRVSHTVTGIFHFGPKQYRVTGNASAFTW